MPIILSLAAAGSDRFAAGPDGLFRLDSQDRLTAIPQPQTLLASCAAIDGSLLVGGAPHGVAFSRDQGENWQAGWMDGVDSPVWALAPDPHVDRSAVLLAASDGGGVLRTADRGHSWQVCNFGLHSFHVACLAWAPPAPAGAWPLWQIVFAGTDEGIYRSPNGGLGWKRSDGPHGAFQTLAVSPYFQSDGQVLAGAEDTGLWRSADGGRTFTPVEQAPAQVNALTALADGWLLSSPECLWHSSDGTAWAPLRDSRPALTFLATDQGILSGGDDGVERLSF